MNGSSGAGKALKAAFPHTVPIFAGFWFLGMSYGIYMKSLGFSFLYPMLMAMIIFGGSLEFLAASMLTAPFAPLQTFVAALMVQSRHLFYGLAMLDRYKGAGWKKPFLIFWMCDESFSINCSADVPPGVDSGWFMLWVSLLNYAYWVSGAACGGLAGSLVSFSTRGIDFVMTAMFIVIFTEHWLKEKDHRPSLIGLALPVLCLVLMGPGSFMIPAMALILLALTALRPSLEAAYAAPALSEGRRGKGGLRA